MTAALLAGPDAGFDHPIEILDGCHERIRRQCRTIRRIAEHLPAHGADGEAAEAAAAVVRFFETAAAHHHRDEEEDLFPALHRFAPSVELNAVRALIARLRADHGRLEALWEDMRERLDAVVAGDATRLDAAAADFFARAYEGHIAIEARDLLPLARRVLDAYVLSRMGERMARRRGAERLAPL